MITRIIDDRNAWCPTVVIQVGRCRFSRGHLDRLVQERLSVDLHLQLQRDWLPALGQDELIVQVIPQAADEFTCYSCFLVRHRSQVSRESNGYSYCIECEG
jgi:hypothetical protein